MSFIWTFLACLILAGPTLQAQGSKMTPSDLTQTYELMRDSLKNLQIDSSSFRQISGVFFEDGAYSISLDSGSFAFLQAVDGRRVAAVFHGTCSATFSPNNPTEIINLRRFYDGNVYMATCTSAVFIFGDDRLPTLIDEFPPSAFTDDKLLKLASTAREVLVNEDDGEIFSPVARFTLNRLRTPFMWARLSDMRETSERINCWIRHDPSQEEPFSLAISNEKKGPTGYAQVCQCADPERPAIISDDGSASYDDVATQKHTVVCSLDRGLSMKSSDRIDMTMLRDSLRWIEMALTSYLKVDSVHINGASTAFFRAKESEAFYVRIPTLIPKGGKCVMTVFMRGDIIERIKNYTVLKTSLDWIPSHSYFHKALYDMTFSYPASMTLVSLGRQVSITTNDQVTTSQWITDTPNTNNSFHIGLFTKKELETSSETPKCTMFHVATSYENADEVGQDVAQSMLFYTRLFGPPPIAHLNATELPGNHGEAFPGLLHLSSEAFVSMEDFFQEQFIAHEVAHQWWGISVKPLSYRDRWLSEGFSEYSCLMYSQLAAQEGDKFFRLLEDYRKEIMSYGKKAIGKDLAPPPIALGHRVSNGTGLSGDGYNTFIYYKGAWVLHMLRNLMIDLRTMKEDAFMMVMREFYNRHKNSHASTDDFRTTIEKLTGSDVKWFFDQWIYGNELPTYRVAWKKDKQPDGQWKVTMRIKQEGVSDAFVMPVPVKVTNEDGKALRMRINVTSRTNEVVLPLFAFEPEDVVFNDLASVLCDVKTERY
ncbi:MAG: M1 family metallopeptidase [Candidatus Kapabacteria bacterium]|nr:M1 family metallopeptidase [Candidatus Kapabacteria bacterium]